MRHDRHYTLDEARIELPWVVETLETMRSARERLTDAEAHELLSDGATGNGGGSPGKQVGEAFLELQSALTEFAEREIVLRDLDRGLVDFPAVLSDREVYLCWVEGEPDIGFWHDLEAGFAGRQEL
jgi:hypothetical protein